MLDDNREESTPSGGDLVVDSDDEGAVLADRQSGASEPVSGSSDDAFVPMGDKAADVAVEPKKSKVGLLIAFVVLVVVIAGGVVAYNTLRQSSSAPSGANGVTASAQNGSSSSSAAEAVPYLKDYDSTVYAEDGSPLRLTEIAAGKPLVMNFWATWCPYCIQEMGDYQAIYNDYKDRVSFAFIDCADGQRETVEKGASWMRDNGYTLPVYFDTSMEAMIEYGASSLPTTVIVAADGEILAISSGVIDPDKMRMALDSVLEG